MRMGGGGTERETEEKNAYRLLVGNPELKRPLGRPICRRVDNIKIDLRNIEWGVMCRIDGSCDMVNNMSGSS
jgi:hypothetical protein